MIIIVINSIGLLICTLISENKGLEKSRSVSNLRKISGPANLDFISRSPPRKKLDIYHEPEKNPGVQNLKFFKGLKQTLIPQGLDFQKLRCRLKGRIYRTVHVTKQAKLW